MYFSIGNPVDLAHDPAEYHPRLWVKKKTVMAAF